MGRAIPMIYDQNSIAISENANNILDVQVEEQIGREMAI